MVSKLNVMMVTIAALLAAGAALPSHYAVPAEDEHAVAFGPPEPEHHGEQPSRKTYHFQYAVHDPLTGDEKSHNEVSDGHGTVTGTYTVVEPDGSKRVVEYTADDEHGFRAQVKKIEQPKPSEYDAPVHGHQYSYVPESYIFHNH
ncbi:cuticle protein 7-like [Sipha flava]|uniref:Cuticle protein 7-like n=2 Tax=Sipha flava TaxID=143950 RepID=A0A8B8G5A4_9HEMI|nr:cuticle protein 7-like [Sipha flava]